MADKTTITADFVRQLLDYDPLTGLFRWRTRQPENFRSTKARSAEWICRNWNSRHAGKVAGCIRDDDYRCIRINGILYLGHRLAWLIVKGEWPADDIDHRLGAKQGDKIRNLRPATRAENMQNQVLRSDSTSGHTGVSWHRGAQKWNAYIGHESKRVYLGLFDQRKDAIAAYLTAKQTLHQFQPQPRGDV